MKKASVLFLLLLAAGTAFAQSRYVDGGGNAFGIMAGFSRNDDATGIEADLGFSIGGNIDLHAGFGRGFADKDLDGEDLTVNVFMLGASFFPLRQSAEIPVSLSVSAGFGYGSYVSDALDFNGWDMTQTSLGFDITILRTVDLGGAFSVQPSIGVGFSSTKIRIEDSFGDSLTDKDSGIGFGVDTALIFATPGNGRFILKPGIGVDEDVFTLSIDAGYLMGF